MQPLTFSTNKHLIPIANKPLIFYPIETIADAGIKNIAITYNPGWLEPVKNILGDGSKWGLKFKYILQEKPLGLANIFQVCEEYLNGDSFVFHLGDNIFVDGIKKQVEYFLKEKPNGLVTMVKHKENWRLGVPVFDKSGRLIDYLEKPPKPPNEFAIPGLYFFDKNVFKCFRGKDKIKPSERGELEIKSPYMWLMKHGHRVDVVKYEGKWLDPGKFDDWLATNQYLLENKFVAKIESKVGRGSKITGAVVLGKKSKIRNSVIKGPVIIGNNVTIIDSYLGPFTSVYDNCSVKSSRIENSILMANVSVEEVSVPIKESIIGTGSQLHSNGEKRRSLELFIGEKSQLEI
jgi:glucose-1-phosphate thymidylyltransferase